MPLRVLVLFRVPAGFTQELDMKTEISFDELIGAWAPLADVSMALDKLMEIAGGDNEIIGFMDDKVKRALEPLVECIDRIEKENPNQFS